QREPATTYGLIVDDDVHAIGADSKRARVQIVNVMAAVDSKVRAAVSGDAVNRLVNIFQCSSSRTSHSNSRWRQIAGCHAIQSQGKLHGHDAAISFKDTRTVGIDRRLHLCAVILHREDVELSYECSIRIDASSHVECRAYDGTRGAVTRDRRQWTHCPS